MAALAFTSPPGRVGRPSGPLAGEGWPPGHGLVEMAHRPAGRCLAPWQQQPVMAGSELMSMP